jgi:hypothetical protein
VENGIGSLKFRCARKTQKNTLGSVVPVGQVGEGIPEGARRVRQTAR